MQRSLSWLSSSHSILSRHRQDLTKPDGPGGENIFLSEKNIFVLSTFLYYNRMLKIAVKMVVVENCLSNGFDIGIFDAEVFCLPMGGKPDINLEIIYPGIHPVFDDKDFGTEILGNPNFSAERK